MSKIRSVQELQDYLDKELSWRIFELSHLTRALPRDTGARQDSFVRASLAMLYAHWEGFVRESSSGYLDYVSRKRLSSAESADCFVYMAIKSKIAEIASASTTNFGISIFREVKRAMSAAEPISFPTKMNTKSNLNSNVFSSVCESLGFDLDKYRPYFNLIDESLLARRNGIAHGKYLDVSADAFQEIYDNVLMLMRWFKTDIENAASLGTYRLPNGAAHAEGVVA